MYTRISVTVSQDKHGDTDAVEKVVIIDFSAIQYSAMAASEAGAAVIKKLIYQAHDERQQALSDVAEIARSSAMDR